MLAERTNRTVLIVSAGQTLVWGVRKRGGRPVVHPGVSSSPAHRPPYPLDRLGVRFWARLLLEKPPGRMWGTPVSLDSWDLVGPAWFVRCRFQGRSFWPVVPCLKRAGHVIGCNGYLNFQIQQTTICCTERSRPCDRFARVVRRKSYVPD